MSWIVTFLMLSLINFLVGKHLQSPVFYLLCLMALLMAGEGLVALYLQLNY